MTERKKIGLEDLLPTTEKVLERAVHVSVNDSYIQALAQRITEFFSYFHDSLEIKGDDLKVDLQLIFVRNVVNFSFWPDPHKSRWMVKYFKNDCSYTNGGYDALEFCFERAIEKDGTKVLSPNFLTHITEGQTKFLFRGWQETEIPMLYERIQCLKNVGSVLLGEFKGKYLNVVEAAEFDAVKLVDLIAEKFASYYDVARFHSMRVPFFKRAQLCARDTDLILRRYGKNGLKNIDKLTAFADYKVPQILRELNVLEYSESLKETIQRKKQILRDDPMEVEIRAATVQAVERIRQFHNGKYLSSEIDSLLWKMTQEWDFKETYHRTRTIFY